MSREQIPLSLVSHYDFCPRRAWLEAAGERSTAIAMAIGTRDHARVDDHSESRANEFRAVEIFDDNLGVVGRADAIVRNGGILTVREYKATPVRRVAEVTEPMRIQLALQVSCLEAMGHSNVEAEVYFTTHRKVVRVDLDDDDFTRARALVALTRDVVTSPTAPEPLEDSPKCARCSHAAVCLPDERRFTSPSRRIMVEDPDSQVVHLTIPGSRAFLRSGQLLVEKANERLATIPLELVQALQVHGNIDVSSGLLRELFWRDIPVLWASGTGRLYGWAQSSFGPNGQARVEQHVASAEGRLGFAREFVASKIANQATQLRRSGGSTPWEQLRVLQRRVSNAETWQQIIGFEGEAASLYFSAWPSLLKPAERGAWSWSGRSGRPAADPINALLNYGYSMLTSDAIRAVIACGLDPHAGFLHSSGRNKPALALDLIEEFRAPVVDSVVQSIINNREVKPDQFTNHVGSWRMDDRARKSLLSAYERRMSTEFRHPVFGYSVSWRRALEVQARQVLGVLDGSQPAYRGIRVR